MEVTQEMIDDWKAAHGQVFRVVLGGVPYYYTTLKRDAYIQLLTNQAADEAFEYDFETIKACVLAPEIQESFKQDITNKSGLGVVLLEQIMVNSGWEAVESEEL